MTLYEPQIGDLISVGNKTAICVSVVDTFANVSYATLQVFSDDMLGYIGFPVTADGIILYDNSVYMYSQEVRASQDFWVAHGKFNVITKFVDTHD